LTSPAAAPPRGRPPGRLILTGRSAPAAVRRGVASGSSQFQPREIPLQVSVRDNNVDQALKVLKKKLQREGVFREMKRRRAYEKPSERKAREHGEAVRRSRKAARKLAQREGLLPGPRSKRKSVGR
jgi:small subunit ribosomal protein S21